MSVPNQKIVFIDRTSSSPSKYIRIDSDLFFLAAKKLSKLGIICYGYFLSQTPYSRDGDKNRENTNKIPYEISTSAISNKTGISTDAARAGLQDLIDNKYLKLIRGNFYQFIDILPEDKIMTPEEYEEKQNYEKIAEMGLNMVKENRQEHLKQVANQQINKVENLKEKYPMYDWESKEEYLERISKKI